MVFIPVRNSLCHKDVNRHHVRVAPPVLNGPHPVRRCLGKIQFQRRIDAAINKSISSASPQTKQWPMTPLWHAIKPN
jgi:hypothetical protein